MKKTGRQEKENTGGARVGHHAVGGNLAHHSVGVGVKSSSLPLLIFVMEAGKPSEKIHQIITIRLYNIGSTE